MTSQLVFFVNGRKVVENDPDPEVTLLQYLRQKLRLTGTKLVCGEGGCGACTVMVSKYDKAEDKVIHMSVNACLAPVCSLHGLAVTTVEGIGSTRTKLHPVQERIAKAHGSQCGYCTPGMVMSMYTLLRNSPHPSLEEVEGAFDGNLCRCTGYRPILEGFQTFAKQTCALGAACCRNRKPQNCPNGDPGDFANGIPADACVNGEQNDSDDACLHLYDFEDYDPSQELIFPPELKLNFTEYHSSTVRFQGERVCWIRPTTLSEMAHHKAENPDARIVVGNTEIGIETKLKGMHYPLLICATHVPELNAVERVPNGIRFGASVTLATIENELKQAIAELPEHQTRLYIQIVEMLKWFAGHQIRNVASVAGNIMTASPISDLNPLFLAAGAVLQLVSKDGGAREIVMNEGFFQGYRKTVIRKDEVLISVLLPFTTQNEFVCGFKQANRKEDDISIVNAGMRVQFEEGTDKIRHIWLAYGGMAPTTVMATSAMKGLVGQCWSDDLISKACGLLEQDLPLSPGAPGGTVEYRRTLTTSFFFKFYLTVQIWREQLEQSETQPNKSTERIPASYRTAVTGTTKRQRQTSQIFEVVPDGQPTHDAVGRPIVHASAFMQATGEAIYLDDMPRFEGELYITLVTSTKAHAKIRDVDPSDALNMPGVVDFIGYSDVIGKKFWGHLDTNELIFAKDEVWYQGQVIGAIIADNQSHSQRAAKAVKITYEELDAIITIQDAVKKNSYHKEPVILEEGDTSSALMGSDHILEGQIHIGAQEHFYFETTCGVCVPKENGEMEVFASTQNPTQTQEDVASALDVPSNRVLCRVKRLGGGFGGKETRTSMFIVPAAVAARKHGVPVRVVPDRDEDMVSSGTRHAFAGKYKVGFTSEGRIQAVEINLHSNAGYTLDLSSAVLERALFHCTNCYYAPNVKATGWLCKTNLPSATAFRGFGGPQGLLVGEDMITQVAHYLKLPPEKVREVNLFQEGQLTIFGQPLLDCTISRCWQECVKQSDFLSRRKDIDVFNSENRWRKRGISVDPVMYGISFTYDVLNQGGALVHVYKDGFVLLTHGGVEMGQGLHTKMIQVASRALGIPVSKIYISETGTNTVPNTSPTAASASSDIYGMAVLDACHAILRRLEPFKVENPKGDWNDWVLQAYLTRVCLSATGFYKTPGLQFDHGKMKGTPFAYFTYGAACSEVEVDCLTGDHEVLRTDIVMDLGSSLNPAIDIGQIEGAFMQGYGLMVLEEYKVSPQGFLITKGPGSYKIPSFGNIPAEFYVSLLKGSLNKRAVYSSKAVGEPPLFLAASVFFALKDAIKSARADTGFTGCFQLNSPATPARIRMACQDRFTKQFPPAKEGTYTPWFVDL